MFVLRMGLLVLLYRNPGHVDRTRNSHNSDLIWECKVASAIVSCSFFLVCHVKCNFLNEGVSELGRTVNLLFEIN